jgi:hypothetical protein
MNTDKPKKLYRVTISVNDAVEHLNLLDTSSCAALRRAIKIVLSPLVSSSVHPLSRVKVSVEPVKEAVNEP